MLTMKYVSRVLALITLTGTVAACGNSGSDSATSSSKPSSDWAADACKTFPAEAASKAAGVNFVKAENSSQTGSALVLVSNCNYSSADGRVTLGILLRHALSDEESIDAQIAGLKSQPDMTGPSEDVPMQKGKAVWSSKLNTLSYVPRDGRMIVVTPPGAVSFGKSDADPIQLKTTAIAIAKAIEG